MKPLSHMFFMISMFWTFSSCQYRLTNLDLETPEKSLCVEGIYDTTEKFSYHDVLRNNIEKGIAKNGRLTISSYEDADLYLKIHLFQNEQKYTDFVDTKEKNPEIADQYPQKEIDIWKFYVEVFDKQTKKQIFQSTYVTSATFSLLRTASPQGTEMIRIYEAREYLLTKNLEVISKQIAEDLVRSISKKRQIL